MREHPTESNFEADAWSLNGDLFYRREDKKPFQEAVRAVEKEEKSLVVIGDEGVLDHYCRLLIGRLKDNDHFHLEVFLSTSKDGLLKRFNQMLANMSIDEARRPANANTSVHLLVINDASAVKDQEWTLLIRLIRDFPGANVRVALFVDKSSLAEFENRFDKLGRRVHRWTVHAPTLEEVRQLKQIGKLKGYSAEVEKMLLIAGLDEQVGQPKEPIIAEPIIPKSLIEEPQSVVQEMTEEVQVNIDEDKQERTGEVIVAPKWSFRRFLLLTLCLSVSLLLLNERLPRTVEYGTTFWVDTYVSFMKQFDWLDNKKLKVISQGTEPLLSDAINSIESMNFSTEDQGPFVITMYFGMPITVQPTIKKIEVPASISVVLEKTRIGSLTQRQTIVEKKGVKTITVSSDDKRTIVEIVLERMATHKIRSMGKYMTLQLEVPVEVDDVAQSEVSLRQGITQNVIQEEALSLHEDGDVASEVSDNEPVLTTEAYGADLTSEEEGLSVQQSSVQRVLAADDSTFFLQHIVFTEESQARDYMNSYEGLESALLVPIRSGENQFLAVLSGPFDSSEEAESWAKELRLPADFWIRNAELLKKVLADN